MSIEDSPDCSSGVWTVYASKSSVYGTPPMPSLGPIKDTLDHIMGAYDIMGTYDRLLHDILQGDFAEVRADRTGVGTISEFAPDPIRYMLTRDYGKTNQFPLLTRRKIFFRGAVEELLFFLRGDTQTKKLEAVNVNFWKGNTTREFLDARGLQHLAEGDMGAGYGWQWRKFNQSKSQYDPMFPEPGIDQIANVIESIKTDPYSRRHVVTAWNPAQQDEMALPPCHILFQFNVSNDGYLSCKMYQRSVDVGCGLPINIASYALLTNIIAKVCGLIPGELIISMGDAHVYKNHVEPLNKMLAEREPTGFPSLTITKELNSIRDIEHLEFSDFCFRKL